MDEAGMAGCLFFFTFVFVGGIAFLIAKHHDKIKRQLEEHR